jgi:hypothetical protein
MSSLSPPKQKETQSEKELARVAAERYQRWQGTYKPLENKYIERIKAMGSPVERARAAGDANAQLSRELGPTPTGVGLRALATREDARAAGGGKVMAQSDYATQARGDKGKTGLVGMGREIENTGIAGLSRQAATEQTRQLAELEADSIRDAAVSDALGVGVGYGLYRMGGKKPPADDPHSMASASNYVERGWS